MALPYSKVPIGLHGGMTDAKHPIAAAPPETLLTSNARHAKDGAISKRPGATKLFDLPNGTIPNSLVTHRGALRIRHATGMTALDETTTPERGVPEQNPGALPSEVTVQTVVRGIEATTGSTGGVAHADHAVAQFARGILECTAWKNGFGYWVQVRDQETGGLVLPPTLFRGSSGVASLRVLALPGADKFVLISGGWVQPVVAVTVDVSTTTPTVSGTTTLTAHAAGDYIWDAVADAAGSSFHLAYILAFELRVAEFDGALALQRTSNLLFTFGAAGTPVQQVALAWQQSGTVLWAGGITTYTGTANDTIALAKVNLSTYLLTVANSLQRTRIFGPMTMAVDEIDQLLVGYNVLAEESASGLGVPGFDTVAAEIRAVDAGTAALSATKIWTAPGLGILAKAYRVGATGAACFPLVYTVSPLSMLRVGADVAPAAPNVAFSKQPYGLVVAPRSILEETTQGGGVQTAYKLMPVARFMGDRAFPTIERLAHGTHILGTSAYFVGRAITRLGAGFDSGAKTNHHAQATEDNTIWGVTVQNIGADLVRVDMQPAPLRQADAQGLALIAGGVVAAADASQLTEATLQAAPERPILESILNGTKLDGNYRWRIVFVWIDGEGNLHRTAPSEASVQHNLTGASKADSVDLLTSWPSPSAVAGVDGRVLAAEIYRQRIETDALYRRVAIIQPSAWVKVLDNYLRLVDPGTAYNTSLPALYTDGGELPAEPAPPTLDLVTAGQRLWAVNGDDPTEIRASKLFSDGFAPEWNAALVIRAPEPILALAAMDNTVVAFSRTKTYRFLATGSNNNGQGGMPVLADLPGPGGIRDPRALAVVPGGILVREDRGVYMLDRSLVLRYVGGGVESRMPQVITGALVDASNTEARFYGGPGGVADPSSPVYDYARDRWSVWNWDVLHAVKRAGREAERLVKNVSAVYQLWRETPGLYADSSISLPGDGGATTSYRLRWESPWLRPQDGDQGWLSVRLLELGIGPWLSPTATLRVGIAYDYMDTVVMTIYAAADLSSGSAGRVVEFRPYIRKCMAFRIVVEDGGAGSTLPPSDAATTLVSLTAHVAPMNGLGKGLLKNLRK